MRNISDTVCREKSNTIVLNNFFRKSCRLWDNVRLFVGARQTTDDNTIHPRKHSIFMLGKEDKEKTRTQSM